MQSGGEIIHAGTTSCSEHTFTLDWWSMLQDTPACIAFPITPTLTNRIIQAESKCDWNKYCSTIIEKDILSAKCNLNLKHVQYHLITYSNYKYLFKFDSICMYKHWTDWNFI